MTGIDGGGRPEDHVRRLVRAERGYALSVRKDAKTYGTRRLAEGADVEGRRIALVVETRVVLTKTGLDKARFAHT